MLILTLVVSLLDVIGVASILPFMAALLNPGLVNENATFKFFYQLLEFESYQRFLFAFGIAVFLLLLLSLALKAGATHLQLRFSLMCEYNLGRRLIEGYLSKPYVWFLGQNSADLGKTILSEAGIVVGSAMMPLIRIIALSVTSFLLLLLLIFVNPILALTVGAVLSFAYIFIYKLMSKFLLRIGSESSYANRDRYKAVSEIFGAIKEIKIGGYEKIFINRFEIPASTYARHQATSQSTAQIPRFFLEAVAFGGMLLLILILMGSGNSFDSTLPIIALYALAGYRLMPALQQIYVGFSQMRFSETALNSINSAFMSFKLHDQSSTSPLNSIHLIENIRLNNIYFSYPASLSNAVTCLNLDIAARTTIGIVGSTGSGKTTTVDLILGILEPQKGCIEIDGKIVDKRNISQWQKSVGYVPQQIYLSDDSVAANIAFGLDPSDIDQNAIERAARIANIHNFVVDKLPHKYETKVGERGVRLSGGQRQRIGIARALYHAPKVLIMDEATSALDNLTEQAVMEAVNNLNHEITIILIAHRLSTVRQCNKIYFLENGMVSFQGTYDELIRDCQAFKGMAMIK